MQTHNEKKVFWQKIIEKRIETGKTIRQFCSDEQINQHVYQYWAAKLREPAQYKPMNLPQVSAPAFLPVNIQTQSYGERSLLLEHNNGFKMTITSSTDLLLLHDVIKILRSS